MSKYFQKSKVFLYPLLDIKLGVKFQPNNTYIAWDKQYTPNCLKFICVYNQERTDEFGKFERANLLNHRLFEYRRVIKDINKKPITVYVFNYSEYESEFKKFIQGKYSTMEPNVKNKLINFFMGMGKAEYYIKSYLYPEFYHEDYAKLLGVDIEIVKSVHEVCSPPSLKDETLFLILPNKSKSHEENRCS